MVPDDALAPVGDVGADLVVVVHGLPRGTGIKDLLVGRPVGAVDLPRAGDVRPEACGEGRLTGQLADLLRDLGTRLLAVDMRPSSRSTSPASTARRQPARQTRVIGQVPQQRQPGMRQDTPIAAGYFQPLDQPVAFTR
jgi:hypothetical protein